jgi:hypothetical protein
MSPIDLRDAAEIERAVATFARRATMPGQSSS